MVKIELPWQKEGFTRNLFFTNSICLNSTITVKFCADFKFI